MYFSNRCKEVKLSLTFKFLLRLWGNYNNKQCYPLLWAFMAFMGCMWLLVEGASLINQPINYCYSMTWGNSHFSWGDKEKQSFLTLVYQRMVHLALSLIFRGRHKKLNKVNFQFRWTSPMKSHCWSNFEFFIWYSALLCVGLLGFSERLIMPLLRVCKSSLFVSWNSEICSLVGTLST